MFAAAGGDGHDEHTFEYHNMKFKSFGAASVEYALTASAGLYASSVLADMGPFDPETCPSQDRLAKICSLLDLASSFFSPLQSFLESSRNDLMSCLFLNFTPKDSGHVLTEMGRVTTDYRKLRPFFSVRRFCGTHADACRSASPSRQR